MEVTLKGGYLYKNNTINQEDLTVSIGDPLFSSSEIDLTGKYIFPGFADVHVHLREPGFSHKETIKTGTRAGAHGGFTSLCSMPNLNPTPDSLIHLKEQTDLIARDAVIAVHPYGTVTIGEKGECLSDMEAMAPFVCGFSDDGKGVQHAEIMRAAMTEAKRLGKMICAHCEDEHLLHGGYIHEGRYAAIHGHKGISSESEWRQIERDIALAKETGCAYHVCHISTKESVALVRQAKKEGINITCETGPHYLLLCEEDLIEDGRFKMNPPLRSKEDQQALIEGLLDGTIDIIATDHAPHTAEEKGRGLEKSAMGIVGLETAFPVLYTKLVKPGILPLERLIKLLCDTPRARFSLKSDIGLTVFDLESHYTVDPARFLSMGQATPFAGTEVYGKCLLTVYQKKPVYIDPAFLDLL